MNDGLRKKISEIQSKLNDLSVQVEEIMEVEQESFDNLPEGMQQGDKGQKMEAAIEALGEARDSIDNANSNLDTAAE